MATDLATIGIRAEFKDITNADKALESLGTTSMSTEKSINSFNKSSSSTTASIGEFGKRAGQAGIQLQQFVGQVQGGVSPMVALSQQATDLGIVLGAPLLGAVVGIGSAIGATLLPSLFESKTATELLEEAIDDLSTTFEESEEGAIRYTAEIKKLAAESEKLAKIELAQTLLNIDKATRLAGNAIKENLSENLNSGIGRVTQLVQSLDSFGVSATQLASGGVAELQLGLSQFNGSAVEYSKMQNKLILATDQLDNIVASLGRQFGLNATQATRFIDAVGQFNKDPTPENIKRLQVTMEELNDENGYANEAFVSLTSSMKDAFISVADGVDKATALKEAIFGGKEEINSFGEEVTKTESALKAYSQALQIAKAEAAGNTEQAALLRAAFAAGLDSVEAMPQALRDMAKELVVLEETEAKAKAAADEMERLQRAQLRYDEAEYDRINKALEDMEENSIKAEEAEMDRIDSAIESIEKQGMSVDELIKKSMEFGTSWSDAAGQIADAFGDAAAVLDNYARKMSTITELQAGLTAEREKGNVSAAKAKEIDMALASLQQEAFTANIGAVGRLAGATAKAFKEQSKERKALHRIETAFAAVEIALAAEKALMSATAAVANQGTGDPYTAFGRIAAMAGIMAAVLGAAGVAFSSNAGSVNVDEMQAGQGTGSVLGSDDKSASIANALEDYQDIGIDQLAELRGIREAMTGLASGIANLAVSLVTSSKFGGGNVTGLGKTQSGSGIINIADKLGLSGVLGAFGDNIIASALGAIFGSTERSLADTGIQFGSQTLGDIFAGGFEATYYAVIETTKKKLFGLSKKTTLSTELSDMESGVLREFSQIFGFIGSTVTESLAALGVDAVNAIESFAISIDKLSFKDMSGEEIQKELEAIFSQQADLIAEYALPAITEWQKMGEGAFETLTRIAREQAVFNDVIKNVGLSLGDLSNMMRIDVAQSIITLMGGLDEFTTATSLYFDKFFSEEEKFNAMQSSLSDVFAKLGVTMPMTREGFRALVDSLDLTTEAGQKMFAALMQLVPGMDAYFDALEKQKDGMAGMIAAADDAYKALVRAVNAEKERINAVIQGAREAYNATMDSLRAQRDALNDQHDKLKDNLSLQEDALRDAASAEIDSINAATDARVSAIEAEKDAASAAHDAQMDAMRGQLTAAQEMVSYFEGVVSAVAGYQSTLSGGMSAKEGSASIKAAFDAARRGDFSRVENLGGAVSSITSGTYASATDEARARAVAQNRLGTIGGLADSRRSSAERTVSAIQASMASEQAQHEELMKSYDLQIEQERKNAEEQIKAAEDQVNAALGIDTSVKTLEQAIKDYQAAQFELDQFGYEEQIAGLVALEAIAKAQLESTISAAEEQLAKLDEQLAWAEQQLNALKGIDDSVMSLADALAAFAAAVTPPAAPPPPPAPTDSTVGNLVDPITRHIEESIRAMTEQTSAAMSAVAKHTASTANSLRRIEQDGLETRQIP